MKIHFIAIGGSAMHNLAIALHKKGYQVSGSDDELFEPSKSRLAHYGLLPETEGWKPERIMPDLDAVILGMHAKSDNPELLKACELGVRIFSYPEYLYDQSKNKTRIVIGGSHGKTTITAMILHALKHAGIDCDYMVGAQLDGFEVMVKLSHEAKIMVIEGDEYLTSPIDRRPKFHLYIPDIAVLSGIAWDHMNVFPTFDCYLDQFRKFIDLITPGGYLIFSEDDPELINISRDARKDIRVFPYTAPSHAITDGVTRLILGEQTFPLQIFGQHNLKNLSAALKVCTLIGMKEPEFFEAITTFKGASKRLELVSKNATTAVYKDFAHAPSKVRATLAAVREQFPGRRVIACLELHTYSSLNQEFLPHYAGTLDAADLALVYFNPHALQLKRLPSLSKDQIYEGFANNSLQVYNDSGALQEKILSLPTENSVFLLMSSGNYDGMDLQKLGTQLTSL